MIKLRNELGRKPTCLKIVTGSSILIILLLSLVYYFMSMPNYVILPIQPPGPSQQTNRWRIEIYSKEKITENKNIFYNWRVETLIFEDGQFENADALDAIQEYFHNELSKAGWASNEQYYDDRCHTILPESKFLTRDDHRYESFVQPENSYMRYPAIVCLAIMTENYTAGKVLGYYVILVTQNASRWTKLGYLFD